MENAFGKKTEMIEDSGSSAAFPMGRSAPQTRTPAMPDRKHRTSSGGTERYIFRVIMITKKQATTKTAVSEKQSARPQLTGMNTFGSTRVLCALPQGNAQSREFIASLLDTKPWACTASFSKKQWKMERHENAWTRNTSSTSDDESQYLCTHWCLDQDPGIPINHMLQASASSLDPVGYHLGLPDVNWRHCRRYVLCLDGVHITDRRCIRDSRVSGSRLLRRLL